MKALALILLTGCGIVETHEVILRPPAGPSAGPVAVYMAGQRVEKPFYEVAILQAVGRDADGNGDDTLRGLLERAHALGCDAVVQAQVDEGVSVAHASGVCVKYLPP